MSHTRSLSKKYTSRHKVLPSTKEIHKILNKKSNSVSASSFSFDPSFLAKAMFLLLGTLVRTAADESMRWYFSPTNTNTTYQVNTDYYGDNEYLNNTMTGIINNNGTCGSVYSPEKIPRNWDEVARIDFGRNTPNYLCNFLRGSEETILKAFEECTTTLLNKAAKAVHNQQMSVNWENVGIVFGIPLTILACIIIVGVGLTYKDSRNKKRNTTMKIEEVPTEKTSLISKTSTKNSTEKFNEEKSTAQKFRK